MKIKESKLAHKLLDGLVGLEIGGSAHNSFGLGTKNVDYTSEMDTAFKLEEINMCGKAMPVDIVAPGDDLPVQDSSQDFVISSHVLEHFPDPIKALKEWHRVIRDGGYIYIIVPHKERTFDKDRERTTLRELIDRHSGKIKIENDMHQHHSVWVTEDLLELIKHLGWRVVYHQDIDDKAGNGFAVAIQKGLRDINPSRISNASKEILFEKFNCVLRTEKDIDELVSVLDQEFRLQMINSEELLEETKNLRDQLENMRSSKFWRLRDKYIRMKSFVCYFLK